MLLLSLGFSLFFSSLIFFLFFSLAFFFIFFLFFSFLFSFYLVFCFFSFSFFSFFLLYIFFFFAFSSSFYLSTQRFTATIESNHPNAYLKVTSTVSFERTSRAPSGVPQALPQKRIHRRCLKGTERVPKACPRGYLNDT